MQRYILFLCYFFIIILSNVSHAYELSLDKSTTLNKPLWYQVNLQPAFNPEQLISSYTKDSSDLVTLSEMRGAAIAKIEISTPSAGTWFVLPTANYVDEAKAYWQDKQGIRKIAQFSQTDTTQTAILMHGQAFQLQFNQPSSGTLWIYIKAKHFAKPVSIKIAAQNQFTTEQFKINAITLITISVMLTLGCMALILYFKTQQKVALFCAGYVGLHGIGWAFAAGVVASFSPQNSFNSHYGGIYTFPFAIGFASLFAFYLFNFNQDTKTRISHFLTYFAYSAFICGVINVVLPFYVAFYLAHLLAGIWVILSLLLGYIMLNYNDFRAKYFFTGNLVYSFSLVIFILSHLDLIELDSIELWVLIALAIDCVCILLSLSEWLKLKQNNYIKVLEQSRIDPLTKVGNRLLLQEKLRLVPKYYFIVFIDCDGIKAINDQLGHATGDQLLVFVSSLISQINTQQDNVFRTGGDEFVCLYSASTADELTELSASMLKSLHYIHQQVKEKWPLSGVSYGLASSTECNTYSECLTLADERMYSLKYQRKKNNSATFTTLKPNN